MKKLALVLGLLVVTSQLPFCPYRILPNDLLASMEYGRQWTAMFLQAYGITEAVPSDNESLAMTAVTEIEIPPVPTVVPAPAPCPMEETAVAVRLVHIAAPVVSEHVAARVPRIEIPTIHLEMDLDSVSMTPQLRREIQKAAKEIRLSMQEAETHLRESERVERMKAIRIEMEKVRKVIAKSA